jgi:hypothetical protein
MPSVQVRRVLYVVVGTDPVGVENCDRANNLCVRIETAADEGPRGGRLAQRYDRPERTGVTRGRRHPTELLVVLLFVLSWSIAFPKPVRELTLWPDRATGQTPRSS